MDGATVLENGISLLDLTTKGSCLEINTHYEESVESLSSDGSDMSGNVVDTYGIPVEEPFSVLRESMISVDSCGFVKKKILVNGGGRQISEDSLVTICYAGFSEFAKEPFDFTPVNRPMTNLMSESSLLPGLQIAVLSMLVGEEAQFLLSYKVMYGELGSPPRIQPKSDCVFYIRLVKAIRPPEDSTEEDTGLPRNSFKFVYKEAQKLYLTGFDLFGKTNITIAAKCFSRAVGMLQICRLADEAEEKRQEKFLIKLYLNLAICYNKLRLPLKTCTMCNEINRLTNIWKNYKALAQNARALVMIGEFGQAERKFRAALQLHPDSADIKAELEKLKIKRICYQKHKNLIPTFIATNEAEVSDEFKKHIDILIEEFMKDSDMCKITMPVGLSSKEMQYVKDAAKQYGLKEMFITATDIVLDKQNEHERMNSPNASNQDLNL